MFVHLVFALVGSVIRSHKVLNFACYMTVSNECLGCKSSSAASFPGTCVREGDYQCRCDGSKPDLVDIMK